MITQERFTPEFQATLQKLDRARHRDRQGHWLTITLIVLVVVAIASFVAGGVYGKGRVDGAVATGVENSKEISALREDMKTVCRQADTAELPTSEQDKCFRAEANLPPQSTAVVQAPSPTVVTPSNDQLLTLIRGVIAANPPKDGHTPTPEELLALIRPLVPQAIPGPSGAAGTPGATPTDAQLLALIQGVYNANPPAPGVNGVDGKNAFCYDNPSDASCQPQQGEPGPSGATGPPGPKPVSSEFTPNEQGTCQYVVTYSDGTKTEADTNPLNCV